MHSLTFRVWAMLSYRRNPWSIANPPNNAQLGGIPYHSPKLHPGPCSSVGMRRRTDTQTRVTTIHFSSSTTHAKCDSDNTIVMQDNRNSEPCSQGWDCTLNRFTSRTTDCSIINRVTLMPFTFKVDLTNAIIIQHRINTGRWLFKRQSTVSSAWLCTLDLSRSLVTRSLHWPLNRHVLMDARTYMNTKDACFITIFLTGFVHRSENCSIAWWKQWSLNAYVNQ